MQSTEQDYEKEKLSKKIAKLSRGVAVIQAAVDEGIVIGGGCTLLRLAAKVEDIKGTLDNDQQKIGADIVKRALRYPMKLIAKNAGVNGSVVIEKVVYPTTLKNSMGYMETVINSAAKPPTQLCRKDRSL
ncbi:RuBisCO large subunit-binding protein subunit beta, chloroplastic [Capsicum baccatum]|uniref:RuBisCO large subunit-binding protein subunit beta, chloroplastic n=1 Tax=Capsicum baccatum TaxID=33114 RepID=A0A2G2W0Y3_CAPBA|nr:RuBisCO large subunit-binding protein subunit beta, chloroplastic [Capsicum baccatum]